MSEKLKLGKYQHYKGNYYEVIGVARHSENHQDEFVVYRALYDHEEFGLNSLWIRPLSMFTEMVTISGREIPRFKYIGPPNLKLV